MRFPSSLWRFYWSAFRKFSVVIPIYCAGVILLQFLDRTLWPFANKWMVQVFEAGVNGVLPVEFFYIILLYVSVLVVRFFVRSIDGYWGPLYGKYLNNQLYRYVYDNDVKFFTDVPSGQVSSYCSAVVKNFSALTILPIIHLVGFVLLMVTILGTLLAMDVMTALLVVGFTLVRGGWQFYWQKKVNKLKKEQVDLSAKVSGCRMDSLDNSITVKMFGNSKSENDFIWDKQMDLLKVDRKIAWGRIKQYLPGEVVWYIMQATVVFLSWRLIISGQINVSDAVFIFVGMRTFSNALAGLFTEIQTFSERLTESKKAFENIAVPQLVKDAPNARSLRCKNSVIEFDNVSFSYLAGKEVIKNMNLIIENHERVGIVGLSGAGKTTLISLILRLYDVTSGAIRVCGMDIRDLKQESLRKNISLVPQDVALFNRTILENIRYAKPNASKKQVIEVAKRAYIHDFIMSLPNGYDTLVGNRGIKLSGGQKQRIAIARAILADTPILILDEATSALDSESEMHIQAALKNVMKNRTTIAVAHRLSTLRNMDRIIVIDKGKIVQSGSHNQLIKQNGVYRNLWKIQTEKTANGQKSGIK